MSQSEARREFFALPLDVRIRNTCPGCGCRLTDDFNRAIALVLGPEKRGQCQKCGWIGTK